MTCCQLRVGIVRHGRRVYGGQTTETTNNRGRFDDEAH